MEAVRRPQFHQESTDEGAEEEDLSELITENPNLCSCSDGDPNTPHERGCPAYVSYDTFRKPVIRHTTLDANGKIIPCICPEIGNIDPACPAYLEARAAYDAATATRAPALKTIHQPDVSFNPPAGNLGQIWQCICAEEDDPNCPALIEFQRRLNEDQPSELTPDNATRVLPRSAVEIAMEKVREEGYDNLAPAPLTPRPHDEMVDRIKTAILSDAPVNVDDPATFVGIDLAKPGTHDQTVETIVRVGDLPPETRNARELAIAQNPFVATKEALVREMVSTKYSMRRRGRMIPERGRMVVARVEWDEKLGSLAILDSHVKQLTQSNQEVVILACGPLRIDPVTGKEVPMRFSIHDVIGKHCVIREHSGIEFITYDENGKEMICYWIGQSEIWGWLEPYPGDEVNSPEIWKAIAYLGEGSASPACNKLCAVCSLRSCAGKHSAHEGHVCDDCVDLNETLEWKIPEGAVICDEHKTYFSIRPPVRGRAIPFTDPGCCEATRVTIGAVDAATMTTCSLFCTYKLNDLRCNYGCRILVPHDGVHRCEEHMLV